MNYKKLYRDLLRKLKPGTCWNILLIMSGIRSGYWCDTELSRETIWFSDEQIIEYRSKMSKILDSLYSHGIRYKFPDSTKNDEGPLVYNINFIKPKLSKIIETNTIEDLFPSDIFGDILGYDTPGFCGSNSGVDFDIIHLHKKDGIFIEDSINLYSYRFPIERISYVTRKVMAKCDEISIFIKKIEPSYSVRFTITSDY